MVWGILHLSAWRKYRRDKGRTNIIAAIVIAGICQILASFTTYRRVKPQSIGIWIAPVIMCGLAAMLIWKELESTTI